jgi:hypothetical protein
VTVENQHRKIAGYRDLTQAEIDLMNRVKALGLPLEDTLAAVNAHIKGQRNRRIPDDCVDINAAFEQDAEEHARLEEAQPERWAAIARTHFQEGLMALTRAVAQPTFF